MHVIITPCSTDGSPFHEVLNGIKWNTIKNGWWHEKYKYNSLKANQ